MELVFRLRLAAPNDTICLLRAYAFRSYVCRSGVGSTGAVFYYSFKSEIDLLYSSSVYLMFELSI